MSGSGVLTTVVAFLVVLSVLVFVHEMGHFGMAKLFGVRIYEFAIGFPPRLFGRMRGETLYTVNAIPLGGYVRMMGENGSDDENPESFSYKPWWQRGVILLGGPMMNICLAIVLFFIAAAWLGLPVGVASTIQSVVVDSPAAHAGLQSGDRIVRVDGKAVSGDNIHTAIDAKKRAGHLETITVVRHGKNIALQVTPKRDPATGTGQIGIEMNTLSKTYSPVGALGQSLNQIGSTFMVIPNLVHNLSQAHTGGVSGPIGIARYTGAAAMGARQYGFGELLGFVALISASLGVFNLLPIPALDGGRIVFAVISGIRRRNFDPQLEGTVHLVGMAVLLLLVMLVSYQDIASWASGQ